MRGPQSRLEAASSHARWNINIILACLSLVTRERHSQNHGSREEETRHTKHTYIIIFRNYTRVFSDSFLRPGFRDSRTFLESDSLGLGKGSQDPRTKRHRFFPSGISTILGG